ncbi:MAG: aminomethyl-transferring glycine dehydrogenase subunit GcvPA [Candidatus Micrarchaeota archaeon]
MNFIPQTDDDRKQMLARIGVSSLDELVAAMKPKLGRELNLPKALSELELTKHVKFLADKNVILKNFRGAGAYHHYIPSAVNHMLLRGEFFTAYTPYQPEVSQGTLQAIYEFQTMISQLTGMDAANASMYDCATAIAEAAILSRAANGRKEIVLVGEINPQYKTTLETYAKAGDFGIKYGTNDISQETSCVVVQNPDYHGSVQDLSELEKKTHAAGALFVVVISDPTSLAVLKPPGEFNADVVVGELQAFGNPMSFGGPTGGFMAVKTEFVKKIPGRLCGMSVDTRGQKAFILTLQAREQHIKRERATSNICSNQGLNALAAVIYLSLLGSTGLRQVAGLSCKQAHELQRQLIGIGFAPENQQFYNEFVVTSPVDVKKLNDTLLENGFLGGVDLGNNRWLLCCTEMLSQDDLTEFLNVVKSCL